MEEEFIEYIQNLRIHATAPKYFLYNTVSNFRTILAASNIAKDTTVCRSRQQRTVQCLYCCTVHFVESL